MRTFVLAVASLVAAPIASVSGQAQTLPHFVLTELLGSPAAQVLELDPLTGAYQPIIGFPSDNLPPLAMAQDPIDGDLLVALWEAVGNSRVVRLHRFAGAYVEVPVVTVPGRVVDLAVVLESVLIAVDAANGGVYRAPRRGGAATLVLPQPNLTAMNAFDYDGLALAWTGRPGTPALDSGVGVMSATQLQWWFGPFLFANPGGREITGVLDMPTGVPRQLLTFDDGTMELFSGFVIPPGQPLVFVPPLPVGATTALHFLGSYSLPVAALGNGAYPFLYTVDPWSTAVTQVSQALPGSPLDFAYGVSASAHAIPYGVACGAEVLQQTVPATAQLGGAMVVAVNGAPNLAVLFAAGLDDFALGQLPATLPGGCVLEVSPDVVLLEVTSPSGGATKTINVPALPALLGTVVHTQWAHYDPAGISVSRAIANWIGS